MPGSKPLRTAFTLVELLVVIAIIAVLVAILVPVVGDALADARSVACLTNLRHIGSAMRQYNDSNRDQFPCVRWKDGRTTRWVTALHDYIGGSVVNPTIESTPTTGNELTGNAFRCPSIGLSKYQLPAGQNRGDYARTGSYGYNWMTFGPFSPLVGLPRQYPVTKGMIANLAFTIMVGDSFGESGMTGEPHAYTLDPPVNLQGQWGASNHGSPLQCPADPRHNGEFHAVFGDGHVASLTMSQAGYDSDDPTGVGGTGNPMLWNGSYDPTITSFGP